MATDSKADVQENHVAPVSVRIPTFWPERPALWFATLEAQFHLSRIKTEETMFYYAVAQLDPKSASEVEDIITNPPGSSPYTTLKGALISRFSQSHEEKIRRLLEKEEIGDRRPSVFLRYLRTLAGTSIPDSLLRTLWVGRLPNQTQAILATQTDASLENLATLADKINEIAPVSHIAATQIEHNASLVFTNNVSLLKQIESLTKQVSTLTTRLNRQLQKHGRRRSRSRSQSKPRDGMCWYHHRFGERARRCQQPCSYQGNASTSH